MFRRKEGKTKIMYLPVTASTAIANGALVAWSGGKLIAAANNPAPETIVGVLRKTIAATDADYAVDLRPVPVEVPVEMNTVWEADVTTGLVAADVGLYQDLTDASTVNRAASTYDVVQCVKVLSTTKGLFHLNIGTLAIAKA